MKNYLLAVVIGIMAFSFNACNDNNGDDTPEVIKNTHRVTQYINSYENEERFKVTFSYDGEKVKTIIKYNKNGEKWISSHKYEFIYSGNNITKTTYIKTEDNWVKSSKLEYVVENGLMTKDINYIIKDGNFVKKWKYNYQYSGSNLINWFGYYYNEATGEIETEIKGDYIYENGYLTKYEHYAKDSSGNWYMNYKRILTYSGDDIIGYNGYALNDINKWIEYTKFKYQYSGNNVTRIDEEWWNSQNETWNKYWTEYSYNSNGFLSERKNNSNVKFVYEYEEGHGNARLFYYYPEDLVYNKPTFKNATINEDDNELPYYKRMMGIH